MKKREREKSKMGSLGELVEDCFGVVRLYSDGSVYRANECDIDFGHYNYNMNTEEMVEKGCLVEWEDCIFDEQHQLYLRVFKPCFNNKNITKNNKLPVVYYIHGGGFCLGSRTWPNCHNYCLRLASQLQALVIAPDYRFVTSLLFSSLNHLFKHVLLVYFINNYLRW